MSNLTKSQTTKSLEQELTSQLNNKHNINTLINNQTQTTKLTNYETSQSSITISKKPAPLVRKAYDGLHLDVSHHNSEPSLTDQSQKDECDVNLIVERFTKTGVLEHITKHQPEYGDFANIPDYQTSLNQVQAAQDAFMELPAKIRARFANDPANFVEFIQNPANQDEMISLGLAKDTRTAQQAQKIAETAPEPTKSKKAPKEAPTQSSDE